MGKLHPRLLIYSQKRSTNKLLRYTAKTVDFGVTGIVTLLRTPVIFGERGGSVVECRTREREVRGSRPTAAVLCP